MKLESYIIIGLLAFVGIYLWHCESVKKDSAQFVAKLEAQAEEQKRKNKEKEASDKQAKEKADAENKTTISNLRSDVKRLRDATNTSGGSVSDDPAGSRCPDGQTCFDTAEYRRADGVFVAGARKLSDEGSEIAVNFNTALKWAAEIGAR